MVPPHAMINYKIGLNGWLPRACDRIKTDQASLLLALFIHLY